MSVELSQAAEYIDWIKTKAYLNAIAPKASGRFVKRGQVYWCHFGLNVGSEMSKKTARPAVIVQNYSGNKYSPNTIVIPVTHTAGSTPCVTPLTPVTDESGNVILDGYTDASHIVCVSKARLGDLIATLPPAQMKMIDKSIAIALDLMKYYDNETEKYKKLVGYSNKLKEERNAAQDKLERIKAEIAAQGFDEKNTEKLKKLLDIE